MATRRFLLNGLRVAFIGVMLYGAYGNRSPFFSKQCGWRSSLLSVELLERLYAGRFEVQGVVFGRAVMPSS